MTSTPWSPKQHVDENTASLGFAAFIAAGVAVLAFQGGPLVGVSWVAIHLALTAGIAAGLFRWMWGRHRRRWLPTVAQPPEREGHVVLEGRLASPSHPVRSPFTGASCVGWGVVDRGGGADSHKRLRWIMPSFLLEDPRGRWRATIRPNLDDYADDYISDVAEASYLGGRRCAPEMASEIDRAAATLTEKVDWPKTICPLYGLELREGDRVVIRGRLTFLGPTGGDGVASYDLHDWSLERGTAEVVESRHGSRWYGAWRVAIAFGSMIAAAAIGLGAWIWLPT